MKTYHVYQKFTKTGAQVHTDYTTTDLNKAQGLVDLINEFGKSNVTGFIHVTES